MPPARESNRPCRFRGRSPPHRPRRRRRTRRSSRLERASDRRDCGLRRAPNFRTSFPSQTHRSSFCRSESPRLRAFELRRLPYRARSNVPRSCCRRSCAFLPNTYCLLRQSARRPTPAVRRGGGVRRRALHALERDRPARSNMRRTRRRPPRRARASRR